jgi:hypothetical protein
LAFRELTSETLIVTKYWPSLFRFLCFDRT